MDERGGFCHVLLVLNMAMYLCVYIYFLEC